MAVKYERGAVEVADGVWAYLQPDGGWGWSNAGYVDGGEQGLLVDTLFDSRLTRLMLEELERVTPSGGRIATVVNTHANGDHCFGNSVVTGAEIVASAACAREMVELPPSRLAGLMRMAPELGAAGAFLSRIFSPFDFEGIELAAPTRTFDGRLDLSVAGRPVQLIEVGPAHTAGDVIVHLPAEGVVFTGDILFHGGHPIVWAGPVSSWVAACDAVSGLGAAVVVPGHGPLATPAAVEEMRGYFLWLAEEARPRFEAGLAPLDAARDIGLGPYSAWGEHERLVVNVRALYREFGAEGDTDAVTAFGDMAALAS
ncbi:MAG TPA: MBL fold metallo-hydrolase [Acidimicrobiales bacterium]|nr:MBL fold metallo-hydrolase [Acidimicrobiales bacterium]